LSYSDDRAYDIAVDVSGNVYVTGVSAAHWREENYVTIKYDSLGVEQWIVNYNEPGVASGASAITVGTTGNVYVTGWSYSPDTSSDYATIKYNSLGVKQWVARYNGPGDDYDEASAIAIDSSENVYVTGYSGTYPDYDYATIKYNSMGVEQWVKRYDGPGDDWDEPSDIAVDGSENVYVTGGSYGSGTSSDYATIKYNSMGVEQWVARYNGPGNSDDVANSISVDTSNNVYVTGGSMCLGTKNDYATIRYTTSGKEQWVIRYNGPGSSNDNAVSLAVDKTGNVYVTGSSGGYYATIKYEQSIIPNTSIMNGYWSNSSIWLLGHVPLSSEDVVIQHNVVLDTLQSDSIQSLIVPANGILSIQPSVGLLKVASVVQIEDSGKIQFLPGAVGMIIYESFVNRGIFESGTSTITFKGMTFYTNNDISFYDFISDASACMEGNITINNILRLNDNLNIGLQDTVQIVNPDTSAIEGAGFIPRGTVIRAISPLTQSQYRFESLKSCLQFKESGTNPENVTITTYPDTNPASFGNRWVVVPSHVDPVANVITADSVTGFSKWVFGIPRPTEIEGEFYISGIDDTIPLIRRVYDINADGGSEFKARLALRYDQSEVPDGIQEDSLKLLRLKGTVEVKEQLQELPKQFSLGQNYPNPFNPITTIRYELPRASFVTLRVYNLIGQEVATLVNEKKDVGRYDVAFSANKLTSGVYFYRLQSGDFIDIKKLILIK